MAGIGPILLTSASLSNWYAWHHQQSPTRCTLTVDKPWIQKLLRPLCRNSSLWSTTTRPLSSCPSSPLHSTLPPGILSLAMVCANLEEKQQCIMLTPSCYNSSEYHNKTITRIFGGNAYRGTYFLALMIFSFGVLRDHLYVLFYLYRGRGYNQTHRYQRALLEQPKQAILPKEYATIVPAVLFILGQTFVLTSTWALGITGTFLGDYFGILMDHRVEGYVFPSSLGARNTEIMPRFPFNVLRDPMYVGSTMCFAATALWYASDTCFPSTMTLTRRVGLNAQLASSSRSTFTLCTSLR